MRNFVKSLKNILTITKYSILMFFREKTAIFFSLFIPVMLMSIFGALNMGRGLGFNLAIVDEAENQYSKQVIETFKKIEGFRVNEVSNKDEAIEALKKGNYAYALVLPKDFGNYFQKLPKIEVQKFNVDQLAVNQNPVQTERVDLYYDQSQNASMSAVGFTLFEKVFDGMTHQIARVPNYFEINRISIQGRDLRYIDYIIPGIVSMSIMQLSIFAVTGQLVSWRERGILKRLLATPIHPSVIIFSQIVSRVIITFMQASLLILMGIILFDLQIVGNIGIVVGLIVAGGLIFLAMGFALSGLASTQNVVAAIANLFVFPQMLLSGIFFPRDALPDWLKVITNYFPLTYFSDAMRQVMIQGANLMTIRQDLLGLLAWAFIMFFLAVRLFRWE